MPTQTPVSLSPLDRTALLDAAAQAIAAELFQLPPAADARPSSPALSQPAASFVTLRRSQVLLGCIGSLEPARPLVDDVRHNAVAAAFDDPRLPDLTPDDYGAMTVKVSVLSPLEPLDVADFDELVRTLRPPLDGLLVVAGSARGTFLPSVWEQLDAPHAFLDALWQKAGLHPRHWPRHLELWRYTTDEFADDGPRPLPIIDA